MARSPKALCLAATLLIVAMLAAPLAGLCDDSRRTGALVGAGLGALMGQVIGRNTSSTLIGAAVGAGVGYLIGNEMDRERARQRYDSGRPVSTGPLGGTKWKAVSFTPEPNPPFQEYILSFGAEGLVTTRQTSPDGDQKSGQERYRVVGDTLIINSPGYLINARYTINGDLLTVEADRFRAMFERIGGGQPQG